MINTIFKQFLKKIIMAFTVVSCTQNPVGGMGGDPSQSFLVDEGKDCPTAKHSGTLAASLDLAGVVATVTTDSAYSSSSLWALDFPTDRFCPVSTGEAGDLLLTSSGDDLALFSRRVPQLNYNAFTALGRTAQQATPLAENGDPHTLRVFNDDGILRWLIAANTSGKLVEFDPAQPRNAVAIVPADLKRSASGAKFRPVDLMVVKGEDLYPDLLKATAGKSDDDYIFALHQGLDANYRVNNSQAIYAWRRIGPGQYSEVDLDETKSGINGMPLRYSNPAGFIRSGDRLAMLSLCFSADPNCKKGVEYIDLIEFGDIHETHNATDLAATMIFTNGMTVGGSSPKPKSNGKSLLLAFASVQMSSGKKIVSIDLMSGVVETIHAFNASGSGFYGLVYDQKSFNLIVGDSNGSQSLMWAYPIGSNGKVAEKPAHYMLPSPGQAFPMQFVLLNNN